MKILVASYGADLAGKHARDTNRLMTSSFYRDVFPNVKITLNRALEIETSQGGVRKATSVSGPATGFGADVIIGDDIQKAGESASELETQRVHEFYSDTLLSRLNNQKTGKILIVQQRLAENDLPGNLREKGNFHILSLPVIAPADEKISLGRGRFHLRKADTMLFPQRDSREVIDRLRKEMGESAFSAQYLQNPSPPGGNRIRMSWFGTYELKHDRNWYQKVVQSWDTAMSAEPTSDYSVCMTWGYREMKWYLLDVHRQKHDFPDLVERANALDRQWTPDMIIIEDEATGKPLFQELKRNNLLHKLCLMHPTASKNIRLEAQTIKLQNETFCSTKGSIVASGAQA